MNGLRSGPSGRLFEPLSAARGRPCGGVRTSAPTFAPMYLLSANGTLRTILILLIIWQVLRLWMKVRAKNADHRSAATRWSAGQRRPKGEVRIERLEEIKHGPPPTDVEDADYVEVKD